MWLVFYELYVRLHKPCPRSCLEYRCIKQPIPCDLHTTRQMKRIAGNSIVITWNQHFAGHIQLATLADTS